jgi:hypothetical protein
MSDKFEQAGFGPEFESPGEVRARIKAIQKAQKEILLSKIRDRSLEDSSRRFLIDSPQANDIVPVPHARIKLVPKVHGPKLFGVESLIVSIATHDTDESIPLALAEIDDGVSTLTAETGYRLGNDLFLEIENPRSFYLLNPEGLYIYGDVKDVKPVEGDVLDHVFTIEDSYGEDARISPEFEWGLFEIIDQYETTLQDNLRRTA